jgi:hypothetical protein
MQDAQVKEKSAIQPTQTRIQQPTPKSRFDDAEYKRWSEKLRGGAAKDK